ncbi:Multidrug/oligosaccharidyl-lipid/polysaccharide, partial [Globisporangium polare]
NVALAEGGNAPLGYNSVALAPLTPILTPSNIGGASRQQQWGDDVEDGRMNPIRRSRSTGSTETV